MTETEQKENVKICDYCKEQPKDDKYELIDFCTDRQHLKCSECIDKDTPKKQKKPKLTTKEYNNKYYAENRRAILDAMNRRVTCECGIEYTFCNRTKHEKTTKHKYNLLVKKSIKTE